MFAHDIHRICVLIHDRCPRARIKLGGFYTAGTTHLEYFLLDGFVTVCFRGFNEYLADIASYLDYVEYVPFENLLTEKELLEVRRTTTSTNDSVSLSKFFIIKMLQRLHQH